MKLSSAIKCLLTCIKARRPVFLWGAPGIGKSQIVAQTAAALSRQLIDLRLIQLDPVDLRGLPKVNGDGLTHWNPPAFLPRSGTGILFVDELNAAPQSMQAAAYQLIHDRRLGDYVVPDGWDIVAAGNREGDKGVTNRMPTPLCNRFIHLHLEADLDDWCTWAISAGIMVELIAFLRFRPTLLHNFDPARNEKAFSSPRTWQFVSDLMKTSPDKSLEYDLISGTVGEGAAAELLGFLKIWRNLPSPDAVLLNPTTTAIPTDPATLYALTGALTRKASTQTMQAIVTYANRMPAEFSVMMIKDIIKLAPDTTSTQAFIQWSINHKDILL